MIDKSSFEWWWIRGLPPIEVWGKYLDMLRGWEKEGQLELVSREAVTPNEALYSRTGSIFSGGGLIGLLARLFGFNLGQRAVMEYDPRGGMKVKHVHLDGNIYLLNDEQWEKLSQNVVQDFQARLGAASTISLNAEQLTAIGAARNALGG